jgi:glycosyltransferase involved in cell wall biosynthesis
MRIHFFVRTLDEKTGGGSHYNSIAYMRALKEAGHTVVPHVLYDAGNNSFPSDLQPIVHQALGKSFLEERAYLAELLKEYEKDADVFFLYAVEFAWSGGLYRREGGKTPVAVYMDAYLASMRVTHAPTWKAKWYQLKRWPWDKFVGLRDVAHVDRFLPCSPYIGEVYKRFGFPKDRFTTLPNIVPPPDEGVAARPNGMNIIYVGRLTYDKGMDLLFTALKALNYDGTLTVVGDGEMRGYIEREKFSCGFSVDMKGWVPQREVARYYRAAGIFVHPARWPDPAPRAIVDALSCGLPVVVPDTGGSSWIAGEAGEVFTTGDIESLTRALKRCITDPVHLSGLAARASEQGKRFEKEAVLRQIEQILLEVTKSRTV